MTRTLCHVIFFLIAQFILPDLTPDLYDIINLEDLEQDDIDWQKWLFGLNAEKGIHACWESFGLIAMQLPEIYMKNFGVLSEVPSLGS
jgi:hypothetical protein